MADWLTSNTELLAALNAPDTKDARTFLKEWTTANDSIDCRNNAFLASRPAPGSGDCHKLNDLNTAQTYRSHASAISATAAQLKSGRYPHLISAIASGKPSSYKPIAGVALDAQKWGSDAFSRFLAGLPPPAPPATPSAAKQVARQWTRLMRAMGHTAPRDIRRVHTSALRIRRMTRNH